MRPLPIPRLQGGGLCDTMNLPDNIAFRPGGWAEIEKERNEARRENEAEAKKQIEEARKQAEKIIAEARAEAERDSEKALHDSQEAMKELVAAATERLMIKNDDKAIDMFLDSVERGQQHEPEG